jgi:hypothetical protein
MSQPSTMGMVMFKSPRTVMPATYVTNMRYLIDTVLTSVGALQTSLQYRTEAYDVDPTLASTAMPGFNELAAIYQRYRTLRISYKFACANQEAFPISIIHGTSALAIASGSLNIQYAGNPLFSTGMLGPNTGKSTGTYRRSTAITDVVGTKQPLFDDLYTGSTTSATLATAGTVYSYLGIVAPAALTALGCFVCTEITLQIQFYRIRPLLV